MSTAPLPDGGAAQVGREAAQPPTPPQVASDSMGSSVTPHALISDAGKEPQNFRLVSAGIDTLDLGIYVRWPSDRLHARLDTLRFAASGTKGVRPPGADYLVHPAGKPPMYRHHLQYSEGQLYLTGKPDLGNFPNVFLSISARSLWLNGPAASVALFRQRLEDFGGTIERIVPSRVDLAADLFIDGGLSLDFLRSHMVTKSRTFRHFMDGEKLQTFYIGDGSSPIQMRIYDKWAEILDSDKVFFFDVWRDKVQGDEVRSMWRVEGQLRRLALKQFGIKSVDDLFAKLNGLWAMLTGWVSLRVLDNPNPTRRTIHPLWEAVRAAAAHLGDPATLTRQFESESMVPVEWYVQHVAGCLIPFAARMKITDFAAAIAAMHELAMVKMPPTAFTARVLAELIRLGRFPKEAGQ